MTTIAVVQARTGSTRLPGKVLADIDGRPLLGFMLARLASLPVDQLVVATSMAPGDDAVAEVAKAAGAQVVRGPEADVLGRFALVLDAYPADAVVRLTADCPLADPAVIRDVIAQHRRARVDYCSNTLVRTFPDGLDVEVISARALRDAAAEAVDPAEREHVTPFVYRRPERYRLAAFRSPERLGDERWTVDTAADLDRVRQIVAGLDDPLRAGWRQILAVAGRHASPAAASEVRLHIAAPAPDEPAVRRWTAEQDGRPVGWVRVTVRSGTGTVDGCVEGLSCDEVMALVAATLRSDLQVTALVGARPAWAERRGSTTASAG